MSNDEQMQALRGIARNMTAADLSILQAALEELSTQRPTLLTTTPGSNNDRLWSQMVEAGWLQHAAGLDVPVPSRVFVINPAARDELTQFVADNLHANAVIAAVNELRASVPPLLIQRVHALDGRPFDLAMMLAGIVESTMRRAIKPELHDDFLREVASMAQGMRSL